MFTARQFGQFNTWANQRLYAACEQVGEEAVRADRGAFFRSIFGTLNHILLVDILYMDRLSGRKSGFKGLDDTLCDSLQALREAQVGQDAAYRQYLASLTDEVLTGDVTFTTLLANPQVWTVPMRVYLTNLFQHQAHHRGQVHNMLSQCGIDAPPIGFVEYCVESGALPRPVPA